LRLSKQTAPAISLTHRYRPNGNTASDYERAIARRATDHCGGYNYKGSFYDHLLPDEATLNVDNFIQLASGTT